MRQQAFETANRRLWEELRVLLEALGRPRYKCSLDEAARGRLPWLYRQVCSHYALARSRRYSPALVAELHDLVLRGHRRLYRRPGAWLWRSLVFIGSGFPAAVWQHARYFWFAAALFVLPALLVGAYAFSDPELIYSILGEDQVADMESMYDPANRKPGRELERAAESDFIMFGFYISNNIGVGFRTFAGGILLGIGSVFLLLFNGLVLGAVAGHLSRIGYQDTFWPFVSGHAALELTAIVICGAAGLMLGHALLAPGQQTRSDALKRAASGALKLVMGAALLLVGAAFVEAFWSSSGAPIAVKYGVAGVLWLLVTGYLVSGGVGRGSR